MKYDVIIAGAGPSGCVAALAAARMGATVLLREKNAYPGEYCRYGVSSHDLSFRKQADRERHRPGGD